LTLLRRRAPSADEQLEAEIATGTPWIYPWRLGDGRELAIAGDWLPAVHATRARLIEPAVRAAFDAAGQGATALDLACNEGWFSHRLLDWGASKVVGVDVREGNIRRATMLRDHFGIEPERFEIVQGDVFELAPSELGQFDVVLLLGLIYHVEDPTRVIRLARACTKPGGVCAIETQLTAHDEPVRFGAGRPEMYRDAPGSFAVLVEEGPEVVSSLGASGAVLSLIPNRAALEDMMRVAGFASWEFAEPSPDDEPQYVAGDRTVALARA
jgi:SAM-dependent methyltransferase